MYMAMQLSAWIVCVGQSISTVAVSDYIDYQEDTKAGVQVLEDHKN